MANLSSVARPYAIAAFEVARDKKQLHAWRSFLELASLLVQDRNIRRALLNPEFSSANAFDLFSRVLEGQISAEEKNFLLLLSQNKRLVALPEITELFNSHVSALEKISTVRVITAQETKDDFRKSLTAALTKRIKHDVKLKCEIDPSILGGAIIHIGDRVIDGSIRGKLARLLEFSLR
jgi:F-type H+-transporting ATPase subunit delta